MGALHAGHRSLIDEAVTHCEAAVVSIFVNPTQFAAGEDFDSYPKTTEADLAICRQAGVQLVFLPSAGEMYRADATTMVHTSRLTEGLCGGARPGHFDGVTTVVAKLLNIVEPDVAFFGEKDYQQLKVIERMVRDLDMPVEIVGCPTVREPDGLAVSSRNAFLSPGQRDQATCLWQAMNEASEAIASGDRETSRLVRTMERRIRRAGPCTIDYVSIVDCETLQPIDAVTGPARICVAVRLGGCRLMDNIAVDGGAVCG